MENKPDVAQRLNPQRKLGQSSLEQIEYARQIAEVEEKIERLKKEIRELEERLEKQQTLPNEDKELYHKATSRRSFLRKAGLFTLGAGAMLLSKSIGVDDNPSKIEDKKKETEKTRTPPVEQKEPPKIESAVQHEIEKCRQIIEKEQYGEIIKTPFLVSSLYYSEQAIKKMQPPYKHSSEEIIGTIYPLINKRFRENYIRYLKTIIEGKTKNIQKRKPNTQPTPLSKINFGRKLENNHLDAIDLFIKEGAPIYSASEGIVVLSESDWSSDNDLSTSSNKGGNTVIIFNPKDESFYRYAHMRKTSVSVGTVLSVGEKIGVVGHTGINATKPGHGQHLHFEINKYDRKRGVMSSVDVFELKRGLQSG